MRFLPTSNLTNAGQLSAKTGLKQTIQHEIKHVGDMAVISGKQSQARLRSAGAAASDMRRVATNKLKKDAIEVGRVADKAVTGVKNIVPTRNVMALDGVGNVRVPAENTHFFENKIRNTLSKAEGVNVGGKGAKEVAGKIDGIEIVNGKVGGKIPVDDFKEIRKVSVHNVEGESLTLVRYNADGKSYITEVKKSDSSYFDLGDDWGEIQKKYNLTNDEVFEYLNIPVLDDAVKSGKQIRFSHKPDLRIYEDSYLAKEWEYLQLRYGFDELTLKGDLWIAK